MAKKKSDTKKRPTARRKMAKRPASRRKGPRKGKAKAPAGKRTPKKRAVRRPPAGRTAKPRAGSAKGKKRGTAASVRPGTSPAKPGMAKPGARKAASGRSRRGAAARGFSRRAGFELETPETTRGLGPETGGQSGDTEGLSRSELADSESVEELLEEGQAFEAGIVSGVENAPEGEVRTRQFPEDDVPREYLDED